MSIPASPLTSAGCTANTEILCGCCAGTEAQTPQAITNRPALSSIAYRVGTWGSFKASMLAALSDPDYPILQLLRTRDPSDFSIALLDCWAVVLDILTFYQERFANEAFLRTAVDTRSPFELARLVGYVPSPGVAASAVLAYTLSSAPGSPDNVPIPAGTRVQSVPGPGQTPQVFESSSDVIATIAFSAIPAQTWQPWQLFGNDTSTWIAGKTNSINVGDALLFFTTGATEPFFPALSEVHYVTAVSIDPISGNTQITWDRPLSNEFIKGNNAQQVTIYAFGKKAALYGAQAPNPLLIGTTESNPNLAKIRGYPSPPSRITVGSDWRFIYNSGSYQINLDASYPGLAPPSSGPPSVIVLSYAGYPFAFQITAAFDTSPNYYGLATKTTQLTLTWLHNFPGYPAAALDAILAWLVAETRNVTAYVQSVPLTGANLPLTAPTFSITVAGRKITCNVAPGMLIPVQGASLAVVGGQLISQSQPVGITGKYVRLQVTHGAKAIFTSGNSSGRLAVADNQIFLVTCLPTMIDTTTQLPEWSVRTLSGTAGTLLVAPGNMQLQPSAMSDPTAGEAAMVNGTSVSGDIATLSLLNPLLGIYDSPTVTVNANAVLATNGETMQEILGNGDSTNNALQFTLRGSPLTYVTAPVGNGSQSTLQVWVNNLQWQEVSNLLSSGPSDRVFTTRVNQQGNTIVQFGNGVQGALTPTGQSNVIAIYRKGIGSAGMVAAGQLSQPLDRPQGLKTILNPSPASGGADPASADDARASAPLPALTIGRVVSLEDYQNFALAYAGIAKAVAAWSWFGNVRGVFLTIAGENGAILQNGDPIVINLIQSIRAASNPYIPLQVASYVPVPFQFTANLNIASTDYNPQSVLAQVWQNLSTAYAFDELQLADRVVASDIVSIMQQTPGVIAVQLTALNLSGVPTVSPTPAMLCASGPQPPQGAQMLTLDPQTQSKLGIWS
jgi:hypothetical protein